MIGDQNGCYFNIGTWRTVHRLGNVPKGPQAFMGNDAMSYLVFFDESDPLRREFEWWHGAVGGRA